MINHCLNLRRKNREAKKLGISHEALKSHIDSYSQFHLLNYDFSVKELSLDKIEELKKKG